LRSFVHQAKYFHRKSSYFNSSHHTCQFLVRSLLVLSSPALMRTSQDQHGSPLPTTLGGDPSRETPPPLAHCRIVSLVTFFLFTSSHIGWKAILVPRESTMLSPECVLSAIVPPSVISLLPSLDSFLVFPFFFVCSAHFRGWSAFSPL